MAKKKDKGGKGKGKSKSTKSKDKGKKKKKEQPKVSVQRKPVFQRKVIPKSTEEGVRHIVRIANTDIAGGKPLLLGLQDVKGIGFMFANALCIAAGFDANMKIGKLDEKQEERLNSIIKEPSKAGIPKWLFNRRKDPFEGEDRHILGPDVKFIKDNDIKLMRKLKTYKGQRHSKGLPVRGQSTKSNFRKNKRRMMRKRR